MSLRQGSVLSVQCWALRAVFGVQFLVFRKYFAVFLIILVGHSLVVKAHSEVKPSPSFFERRAEGWHWYESQEPEIRKQESGLKGQKPYSLNPTQVIEEQRKALETKLHAAIVEPSRENIISYILAQRALMDQSQRFSEAWKRVVLTTPSLDETLIHPIDQNARHIYYDKLREERTKHIKTLAQDYGLFFFFRQNCPYCHGFAPIVKRFSEKYGWSVLGISLDGGTLPEFPRAKRDNGMGERLHITHVPALIALHPQTGKLIPLAYGMVSETEVEERLELLTQFSANTLDRISSRLLQGVQR